MPKSLLKKLKNIKWDREIVTYISLILIPLLAYTFIFVLPKNPRFKKARRDSNYIFVADGKDFDLQVGLKDGNHPQVDFQTDSGQVTFNIKGLEFVELDEPEKERRDTVSFRDVQNNIDLRYTTLENGIKEEIILNERGTRNTFWFDLDIEGAHIEQLSEGFVDPVLYDEDGEYLFHFVKPYAYDEAGNETEEVSIQILEREDGFFMEVSVNQDWLDDKDREYPVYIDPTIVHDTTGEFALGEFNRNRDVGSPEVTTYYQPLAADENTVALWHMEEGNPDQCTGGSNDICDSSDNGHDGLFVDNAAHTTSSRIGDYATTFDAAGDYISVPDADDLDLTTEGTIEIWAYKNSQTSYQMYLTKGNTTEYQLMDYSTTGQIVLRWGADANHLITDDVVPIDQWTHLAGVYDGSYLYIYINGELSKQVAHTTDAVANAIDVRIGARNDGYYFDGILDEARISNIARTPEEILASYSRSKYSIFTSGVLDLTTPTTAWNSLSWSESGVGTGDGETVFDDTGLVAQWNLNETSGTTANNDAEGTSCGGTPANCDGTLSGFDSTASQDADPDSSWTADNRKWGAGALKFDGTDSYVTITDNAAIDLDSSITLESWVNPSSLSGSGMMILAKRQSTTTNYELDLEDDEVRFVFYNAGWHVYATSGANITPGNWYHIVATYDEATAHIYINGKEQSGSWTSGSATTLVTNAIDLYIGRLNASNYFDGVIDTTRVYSRILSASEILSNYNSSNIQFQTRVGADTTPNDGSWDAWSPTSGETLVEGFNNQYLYDTVDANLISYWPMDETADNSCTGGEDACDVDSTNDGTDSGGSQIVDGAFGKAREFDGSADYLNVGDAANIIGVNAGTVSAWIYVPPTVAGSTQYAILGYGGDATDSTLMLYVTTNASSSTYTLGLFSEIPTANKNQYASTNSFSTGMWHHVAYTSSGTAYGLYLDGVSQPFSMSQGSDDGEWFGDITGGTNDFMSIGARNYQGTVGIYFKGIIDEVRFYDDVLSTSEVQAEWMEGEPVIQGIHSSSDPTILLQGSYAKKIALGVVNSESSTVGYWDMDETNGDNAGYDIFDQSSNSLDGEFNGTNLAAEVIDGVVGKARNFNGTDDYISTPYSSTVKPTEVTVLAWIKQDVTAAGGIFSWQYDYNGGSTVAQGFAIYTEGGDTVRIYSRGGGEASTDTVPIGKWTHVAVTSSNTNNESLFYINGKPDSGGSQTRDGYNITYDTSDPSAIGSRVSGGTPGTYFDGNIDEVIMFDRILSSEEISEYFDMGREEKFSLNISSTDLSAKSMYALDIASDRTGTFLETMAGESNFANGLPDENTMGLWNFEEIGDDICDLGTNDVCDSSGNGNHGDGTSAPPIVKGYRGLARESDGVNDYIKIPDSSSLDVTMDFTLSGWVMMGSKASGEGAIVSKGAWDAWKLYFVVNQTDDTLRFRTKQLTPNDLNTTETLQEDVWTHVAAVNDNGTKSIYINGKLSVTGTTTGTITADANPVCLHGLANGAACSVTTHNLEGDLDEIRIDNVARTATEIRQAYENGRRSHPITIDFGASLDSGNLITNTSDYSFTIDATTRGLTEMGSHLFTGDKIIIKENDDGVEYIAQGTVTAITESSGVTTVDSWDSGSTVPSSGFTVNATVFKWQTEYVDLSHIRSDDDNAITDLTYRITNGSEGRDIWIDNMRSVSNYLTDSTGSTITSSTGNRYFQYRSILSSADGDVSASLTSLTLDYTGNNPPTTPTIASALLPSNIKTVDTTPTVNFTSTDTDLEDLTYQIQWDTDSDFLSATTKTSSADTGFANTQDSADTDPFTYNETISYTWQSALTTDTTYFYQVRAFDGYDYSSWSEIRSITIDTGTDRNSWYQTHADQFNEGTVGANINVDDATDSVKVTTGTDTLMSPMITDSYLETESRWGELIFTDVETTGSILYKVYYDVTGTPTMVPDGALTGNSSGFGTSPVDLTTVDTATYPELYIEASLTYSGGSPELQDWEVTLNKSPNLPTQDLPTDGSRQSSLTPYMKTTASDNDADWLRYKIDLCLNRSMTIGCQTFDQTSSQTGWTGQNVQSGTAYGSGIQATYTIQTALEPGTVYYWRSYATDPVGASQWSSTQSDPYWFMTNSKPRSASTDMYEHYIAKAESQQLIAVAGWSAVTGTADAGTTASTNGWIDDTNFTVGERYLVMAFGAHQSDNSADRSGIRVKHGGTAFSESETTEETDRTGTNYKTAYQWFTIWTAQSGEDLEVEIYWANEGGTTARIEDVSLIAINAEELITNGHLQSSIDTTGGALTTSFVTTETLNLTSSATSQWLTLGYTQWDIETVNSEVQALLDIDGTDQSWSKIDGEDTNDTPLYGFGAVSELGVNPTVSIESKRNGGSSTYLAQGLMSLDLSAFEQSTFDTTDTPHEITSGTWAMEEVVGADLISNISTSWMQIGGSLLDDNGNRVLAKIRSNGTGITDTTGGWQHNNDNIIPNSLFNLSTSYSGSNYIIYEAERTIAGATNPNILQPWITGISLEKYNTGTRRDAPSDSANNQSIFPAFQITSIDPDDDKIRHKIDLCENSVMTTNCQTFDQTSSQTGWSGQNALANTAYDSGTTATYTIQSALPYGTTHYWKAYAIDNSTGGAWTAEQTTPYSFTTTQQPDAPSSLEAEQQTNPTGVDDDTPEFSAIHGDPDGDSALFYQINVNTNATFTGTSMWDSTKTATNVANGNRSSLYVYAGTGLDFNGTTYYWRIKFWDGNQGESDWSSTAQFTTVVLESPAPCSLEEAVDDSQITINWADKNSNEDSYEIERSVNGGSFTFLVSKLAGVITHVDSSVSQGNTYAYRLYTKKSGATSDYCTTSTLTLNIGNLQLEGLQLGGIKLD